MRIDRARKGVVGAVPAALAALAIGPVALGPATAGASTARATAPDPTVTAAVAATPAGPAMPKGFVGLSIEYSALRAYTGANASKVNPVLVQLVRNLAPGQSPVVRVGGDSTDSTWWPVQGLRPPGGITYTLNRSWLGTTAAFAREAGAHLIMGVNLAAGIPAIAKAEAKQMLAGIGRRYVQAFEIGNEPDVYGMFPWYKTHRGQAVYSRSNTYDLSQYIAQFSRWRSVLPSLPVAGPAFAELNWLSGLSQFISSEPGLGVITLHRYPLRACVTDPTSPIYASIPNLLADQSSSGLAVQVAPYVTQAHSAHLPFRLDELNSASCSGKPGVSNTFASALWVLDTLFNLAQSGVDGVNIHTLPGAAYAPFSFTHTKRGWHAFVHPEYYGMLLFAQAIPPGAQLLPVNVSTSGPLKIWATQAPDGQTHIVVINKDTSNTYQVQLQVPEFGGTASLERLEAPSVSSTTGVTLGGQTFGNATATGQLAGPLDSQGLAPTAGEYTLVVPPASAAMLTE